MVDFDQDKGAARADLCRLLAACYYQPGPEFAEEKVFDAMLGAASRIDAALAVHARRLGEEFAGEDPAALLVDYTRLFLGPVDMLAKPYGSAWLGGDTTLMQESSMAVAALYEEGGFEIAEDFRELPDHVAAELEFLYLLIFREAGARLSGDVDALHAIAGLRKRFLDQHLARWVGRFTAAVSAGAQSAYYRELAALTNLFVTMEASH